MLAQPSRDWNVFKQIFAEHWDGFTRAHPRYQTSYYDDLVAKMLACGNPDKMGYLEYRCLHCGRSCTPTLRLIPPIQNPIQWPPLTLS
jgi:hypothetical protein